MIDFITKKVYNIIRYLLDKKEWKIMYKLAVFDLDGTLADTLTTIAYYGNMTLKKFGFIEADKENYKYFAGDGYIKLVERMLKFAGGYNEEDFDEIASFYYNSYDKEPLYLTTPYDGICEMLEYMKESGVKTAVLSNKPHDATVSVVKEIFKDFEFSYVLGGRKDIPLKPNPAALNMLIEKFGIEKSQCIYVGDTSIDMLTGKNADVCTIGVTWGFRDKDELSESGADLIVDHPSEIIKFLKNEYK